MSNSTKLQPEPHVHGPGCGHHHHDHTGTYVRKEPKLGRNEPCPCGSGKKYKKCCGASAG